MNSRMEFYDFNITQPDTTNVHVEMNTKLTFYLWMLVYSYFGICFVAGWFRDPLHEKLTDQLKNLEIELDNLKNEYDTLVDENTELEEKLENVRDVLRIKEEVDCSSEAKRRKLA